MPSVSFVGVSFDVRRGIVERTQGERHLIWKNILKPIQSSAQREQIIGVIFDERAITKIGD